MKVSEFICGSRRKDDPESEKSFESGRFCLKWTVRQVDGHLNVDDSSENGRSRGKADGHHRKSTAISGQMDGTDMKWTNFCLKVDGPRMQWTLSNIKWFVGKVDAFWNRPLSSFFDYSRILRPSTFIPYRPTKYSETVHFHPSLTTHAFLRTVQFYFIWTTFLYGLFIFGALNRPLSHSSTVHFHLNWFLE